MRSWLGNFGPELIRGRLAGISPFALLADSVLLFDCCFVLCRLVLSCLVLSCRVLSCLVLACLVLSCLVLCLCLVFFCRVLSCLVLVSVVLSYLRCAVLCLSFWVALLTVFRSFWVLLGSRLAIFGRLGGLLVPFWAVFWPSLAVSGGLGAVSRAQDRGVEF